MVGVISDYCRVLHSQTFFLGGEPADPCERVSLENREPSRPLDEGGRRLFGIEESSMLSSSVLGPREASRSPRDEDTNDSSGMRDFIFESIIHASAIVAGAVQGE